MIPKLWGYEDLLSPWGKHCIVFSQGRTPLHSHDREEVMYFEEGLALIESGQNENALSGVWADAGEKVAISGNMLHRITALRDTSMIEMSANALGNENIIAPGGKIGDTELRALLSDYYRHENRNVILGTEEAAVIAASFHASGKSIGLCGGAFDMLHLGHIELLHQAKQRCEVLFVAILTDAGIAAVRPGRPFIGQKGRTGLVAATKYADYVVLANSCTEVIKAVRPTVYVTTTEYGTDSIERKEAQALGIPIQVVEMLPGYSTSKIANVIAAKEKSR